MHINDQVFSILFDSPSKRAIAEFISNGSLTCTSHVPNPFEGDNLSGVFWRLSESEVFTPEARKEFLEISEMIRENLEVEGQAADAARAEVKKNLSRFLP